MNNNVEVRKVVLNGMLAVFAALFFWYVFILGNMVFNIAERKVLEKEVLTLTNEVRNLELSYLAVSNSIDSDLSVSMGFKETKATFATRKALGRSSMGEALGSLKIAKNEI